jgi:hypothetical protein
MTVPRRYRVRLLAAGERVNVQPVPCPNSQHRPGAGHFPAKDMIGLKAACRQYLTLVLSSLAKIDT